MNIDKKKETENVVNGSAQPCGHDDDHIKDNDKSDVSQVHHHTDDKKMNDNTWASTIDITFEKLKEKQSIWSSLSVEQKLVYIDDALIQLSNSEEIIHTMCSKMCSTDGIHGLDPSTEEYHYTVAIDKMVFIAVVNSMLVGLQDSFRVMATNTIVDKHAVIDMKKKYASSIKALNGYTTESIGQQVVANVFPLTTADKFGPTSQCIGQLYFQNEYVKKTTDIKPFHYNINNNKKDDGVAVVLGAGNYVFLTVNDVINTLFQKNQVCYLKHHHLRNELEILIRHIFRKLYNDGYIESCIDNRSTNIISYDKLLYHPIVTSIHITGGKKTHDIIVWGSGTEQEQLDRQNKNEPKLDLKRVDMTSELGCATPYIIIPYQYTNNEIQHQIETLLSAKLCNGGASCNAPQVIIISDNWKQKDTYKQLLYNTIEKKTYIPNAFYPGSKQRYDQFRNEYKKSSRIVYGRTNDNNEKRVENKDFHLPLLVIEIDVDISTTDDMEQAKKEYALRNEAFGPILVIVTLKNVAKKQQQLYNEVDWVVEYMKQVVTLCNECLYGTLSATVMVPDVIQFLNLNNKEKCMKKKKVTSNDRIIALSFEEMLQDLHYSGITTNMWSAGCYNSRLAWGGYQRTESIYNIESGIGIVNNSMNFDNIDKGILRSPIIDHMAHSILINSSRPSLTKIFTYLSKFLLKPNIISLTQFIISSIEISNHTLYTFMAITTVAVIGAVVFTSNTDGCSR